jgi:hypothetical protein
MREIFVLKQIWSQGKINILVGTFLVEIVYLLLSTGPGSEL